MFTKEDVKHAWFASRIDVEAAANQSTDQSWEKVIEESLWQLASIADTKENQEALLAHLKAEYDHGKEILSQANLMIGNRYQEFTANPYPLVAPDAPTIKMPAGYIATSPAVVEVTLLSKESDPESWLTPVEVANLTGTSDSQWRNKAAAKQIPGAVKKGKQWLLPRSMLEEIENA